MRIPDPAPAADFATPGPCLLEGWPDRSQYLTPIHLAIGYINILLARRRNPSSPRPQVTPRPFRWFHTQ